MARVLRAGLEASCPRCGGALARQDVPTPSEVPYVRDRIWFRCEVCPWSLVLDRRRLRPDP